eukprot:TRINITY_DN90968_c0_g1_i1.p1 TRINITY_DN90968_c0_g1~~TRINITY_DN90968_c0_g1_i1.p1  ORF type:complete len:723 (+),score=173.83 TRINITY_DN90968_c0_g1_i1:91-2259(+)
MARLAAAAAVVFVLTAQVHGAGFEHHLRQGLLSLASREARALLELSQECQCTFESTCSCKASVHFMQCIADACNNNKCDCQGAHFMDACGQMGALCPAVGLQCYNGQATCTDANTVRSAVWEGAVDPKAPQAKKVQHTKATAPAAEEKPVADAKSPPPPPPALKEAPKAAVPAVEKTAEVVEAPLDVVTGEKEIEIFPVPTTSRCIVIIVCQYMIIFTALAIVRSYAEFTGSGAGKVENALQACAQTVTYGPMLCVLFIACRMRVEFLSNGKDQPQMWVQNCMYGCTYALLATTLLVLIIPLITGKPLAMKEGTGEMEKPTGSGPLVICLTIARYCIQLGLYGGIAGVIVGINTYTPPGEDDLTKLPPPAPAVACTMILAVMFFAFQLVIAASRSYTEFTGKQTGRLQQVMNAATETISFAPMLSIVFLAARMRALQHKGQPQAWAQDCMYSATYSLVITSLLSVLVPILLSGHTNIDPVTKQVTFELDHPLLGFLMVAVKYLNMLGIYIGTAGVIYSIFVFEAPSGPTLPVSPTVQCVVNLCCQYFLIYLLLNVMNTVAEVSGGQVRIEEFRFFAALNAAKATVAMAPMLSILFVTTRMYALLITNNKGAPQAWVQEGMFQSTWSLMISFVMCLAMGLVMEKVEIDEDGNVVNKFANKCVAIAMTCVRYFAMVLLYGGIMTVVIGLFVMTPETANGRGSIPVVSDVVGATPIGQPPPSPGS